MADKDVKPHLYLGATGQAQPFTSPPSGGGRKPAIPAQDRQQHGGHLMRQLRQVESRQAEIYREVEEADVQLESPLGIQVAFESFPGVELAVESLADARQHIELLNIRLDEETEQVIATVFVPEGKLTAFEKKLQAYMEERKRDHRTLIDAIRSFRVAALEALWSDGRESLPTDVDTSFWWEVWLPVRGHRDSTIHDFRRLAEAAGMRVSAETLKFPERSILLAYGSRRQLSSSGMLLSTISELRRAKETAEFFDELDAEEQREWAEELLERLELPDDDTRTPYVSILDTGANIGHPLLQPFATPGEQFTVNPDWGVNDVHGHGTGMAGLALWGDLTQPLASSEPVPVRHRLESVKLLRYSGDNQGKHLGLVTAEGVSLPEIDRPGRSRAFVMALTSEDARDRGRPSAWSATLDSLTVDYLGDNQAPRLLLVSAGNATVSPQTMLDYPGYLYTEDIRDPAQSWNAITVGAYTDKDQVTESPELAPVARAGEISPFSSTSQPWRKQSPLKPEVVFEGGNVASNGQVGLEAQSLSLLTTYSGPETRLFASFNATSAATALAGKFAAEIQAHYPGLWPETVRGLIVHSAQWTPAMDAQFLSGSRKKQDIERCIRCVGYGVPSLERALWSVSNSLSLVIEDTLHPFRKEGSEAKTRDMHLHDLPWPDDILAELGQTPVSLTVTLSYFIEPNPSSRMVSGRYSYQSHSLRFDVKHPLESSEDFQKRINTSARDEDQGAPGSPSDSQWLLGKMLRHRGSLHKDVWQGTAAELAERGQIAVYPAMGWWRTRKKLERYDRPARYSLIVTLSVPDVDVDIYTSVSQQIGVPVEIEK